MVVLVLLTLAAPASAGPVRPGAAGGARSAPPGTATRSSALEGAAGEFTPVSGFRVFDTRDGTGTSAFPLTEASERAVKVTGHSDGVYTIPSDNVLAVVVNLTAVNPTSSSFLRVFPNGSSMPGVSNLNVTPGRVVSNRATVAVGASGQINVYNHAGWVHVIVDVVGYYSTAAGTPGGRFVPSLPTRLLDTRSGFGWPAGKPNAGDTITLQIGGQGPVPFAPRAAVLNVTATDVEGPGFLTAHPQLGDRPDTSDLNITAGETRANLVIVPLSYEGLPGSAKLYTSTRANVIADVVGWYTIEQKVGDRGRFVTGAPYRLFDTREDGYPVSTDANDFAGWTFPPGGIAAATNVTAVEATGPGFLSVAPADVPAPSTSSLNYAGGDIVPNHVLTGLSTAPATVGGTALPANTFLVRAGVSPTHVVVDIFGAFLDGTTPPT